MGDKLCEARDSRSGGWGSNIEEVYCALGGECEHPNKSQKNCPIYQGHFGKKNERKERTHPVNPDYSEMPLIKAIM